MKKHYILAAAFASLAATAQVPNAGFEESPDGLTLKNWGAYYPIPVSMNPATGESTSDIIAFQNGIGFSFPTGNCLTGSWSMALTNAYNFTKDAVIRGKAELFDDSESMTDTGWNAGIPVEPGANIEFLGFDYQFFSDGGDTATARLELFDAGGNSLAHANIVMNGFNTDFQYVYAPLEWTMAGTPARMHISFDMAQSGNAHMGSMLLVDNVVVNTAMLNTPAAAQNPLKIYPTLTEGVVNISGTDPGAQYRIVDMAGKTVHSGIIEPTLDLAGMPDGLYLLKVGSAGKNAAVRIIKK